MVERSIAWLVRGNRKVRYRGTTKNDWWLHHRAAAVNLRRLITLGLDHTGTNWVSPTPRLASLPTRLQNSKRRGDLSMSTARSDSHQRHMAYEAPRPKGTKSGAS